MIEYTNSKVVKIGKFPCSEKMGRFLMEVFSGKRSWSKWYSRVYTKSEVVKIGKFPCSEKMGRFLMEVFSAKRSWSNWSKPLDSLTEM